MRRITVVGIVAAILAIALPAQAKVAGSATISGPGIGGGITMGGTDGSGFPVMTGLLGGTTVSETRPPGPLGPRYVATFVIEEPPGQPTIVQHLYPFAAGGPLVYTPPGQRWLGGFRGTAQGGWFRAPAELVDELRSRGLPAERPSSSTAVTRPAGVPATRSAIPWVIGGLAAVGLVAAMAARRRVSVV